MMRLRFPVWLRRMFYAVLATSWITGITFFVLSRWLQVEGEFGPEKHPWQFPVLQIHGAAAFLMLMAIGSLLTSHVPSGWRTFRSRRLGITLVTGVSFMAISAWVLYYAAGENLRPIIGNLHASVGVSLPLLLTLHIWHGRRHARERAAAIGMTPARKSAPATIQPRKSLNLQSARRR